MLWRRCHWTHPVGCAGSDGSDGSAGKVLKMDRPLAGGFLSLTGLWPEGCGIALWAMSFISRLRRSRQHRVSILSAYLVHPFPLRGTSPPVGSRSLDSRVAGLPYESSSFATSREKRDMRKKTASHILHVPFRRFPPLVAGATTFPPQAGALWVLSNGAMSLQESIEQFILPPLADRGALGAASQSAEFLS